MNISPTHADVIVSNLFSDHMVLQRGRPVPVWGWARPGQQVRVRIANHNVEGVAKQDGTWRVEIPSLDAAENLELIIESENERKIVSDVAVGEVWLCSGQSNMEWPLLREDYPEEIAQSSNSEIRFFLVPRNPVPETQSKVSSQWRILAPDNAGTCSAVGYFMARELRRELGVPIGLVLSYYGGSSGEAWVSRYGLSDDPELNRLAEREIAGMKRFEEDRDQFPGKLFAWGKRLGINDTIARGDDLGWEKPSFDFSAWSSTTLPFVPATVGFAGGMSVWLRRFFDIGASGLDRDHDIDLGWTSSDVRVWWNGVELKPFAPDAPRFFTTGRHFRLPAQLLQEGRGELVVRCFYHIGDWSLWQTTPGLHMPVKDPKTVGDKWLYRVERELPILKKSDLAARPLAPDRSPHQTPTYLYNGMIAPIVPYALGGVVWYQGETNTGRPHLYRHILHALIEDWRGQWGQEKLPFLIVQLPNYNPAPEYSANPPPNSQWALFRDVQREVAATFLHTGLAVTIDIGDGADIHPRNKRDVGFRLSRVALAEVYSRPVDAHGPEFASFQIEGDAIRIFFKHASGLCTSRPGPVQDFMLAEAAKRFFWAEGTIEGESIIVRAVGLKAPVAVRFAWFDNPARFSLYNGAGLPAIPFRTDNWPGIPDAPFPP